MTSATDAPQSEQNRALVAATLRVPRQIVPATAGACADVSRRVGGMDRGGAGALVCVGC
jgi:hypothetical protein